MSIKIYHNPRCSKSRQTLQLLEEHGAQFDVIEYLKQPPSKPELVAIIKQLGKSPRDVMRKGEAIYKELSLSDQTLDDEHLLSAMLEHPILIERPIVVANNKAAIGRPPESVLGIL